MPIYPYLCGSCGHHQDILQKMSAVPLTTCPECNSEAFSKQLSAPAFQLKGSGWYVTDFRENDKKPDGADKTGEKAADKAAEGAPPTAEAAPASGAAATPVAAGASVAAPAPAAIPSPAPAGANTSSAPSTSK
jgi:putative FmdB family regulatory protein